MIQIDYFRACGAVKTSVLISCSVPVRTFLLKQHFLNFFPLLHGHGSFGGVAFSGLRLIVIPDSFKNFWMYLSLNNSFFRSHSAASRSVDKKPFFNRIHRSSLIRLSIARIMNWSITSFESGCSMRARLNPVVWLCWGVSLKVMVRSSTEFHTTVPNLSMLWSSRSKPCERSSWNVLMEWGELMWTFLHFQASRAAVIDKNKEMS